MFSHLLNYARTGVMLFAMGLFFSAGASAARMGGYDRGVDDRGGYINDSRTDAYSRDWGEPAVVIENPDTDYSASNFSTSCSTVQQCDANGNCTQNQICN